MAVIRKTELDKHKFDTRWRFALLVLLLLFAAFLQLLRAPMANEFIALVIGLMGGEIAQNKANN